MEGNFVSKSKEVLGLLREVIVIVVIASIFIFPSYVNNILNEVGLTEFDLFGFRAKIEKEANLETLTQLENIRDLNNNYQTAMDSLEKKLAACGESGTEVTAFVDSLKSDVAKSQRMIEQQSSQLVRKIETQQMILEKKQTTPIERTGWLYVGWVNEEKNKMAKGKP